MTVLNGSPAARGAGAVAHGDRDGCLLHEMATLNGKTQLVVGYNGKMCRTDEAWLEQHLESMEAFGIDSGDVVVWKLAGLPLSTKP